MGKQISLTLEKLGGSATDPLREAMLRFERAPQGSKEQALAFEGLLRMLASHKAKNNCAKARQSIQEAA